ncbi:MAG: glycosyltransferase family 2 protein [Candidatus Nitrotoga sp.]
MKLSIVATMYRSFEYVDPFCERIATAAREITDDFEIILVNDGSPDDALQRAVARAGNDPRLIVVDLSRNFGHHKAMMTGLDYAQGDLVYLTDIDLEEPPEWVIPFHTQLKEQQCDVVYGQQAARRGGWFERWSGQWFYSLVNALTDLDLPHNLVTSRLMTRRYVRALLRFKEREFFIAGLWQLAGFDQRPQVINKLAGSETTYTLRRKLNILVQMVTSFSAAPLRLTFYFGAFIFVCAAFYTTYLVINQLFLANPMPGWTSVMASVWLLGGTIIALIGMIGIYLAKVFTETKHRPYTIVRQVYGTDNQRLTVLDAEV